MKAHSTLRLVFFIGTISWMQSMEAQELTLFECHELARTNSELSKNFLTLQQSAELDDAINRSDNLPSVQLSGQATYQSDVVTLPFAAPGISNPIIPKDQYRLALQLTQKLYDGGITNAKRKIDQLENQSAQKSLEIKLYELKGIISNLYFSILQSQATEEVLALKKNELDNQQKRIQAGIQNGIILPSSGYTIEKEIIKLDTELSSLRQLRTVQLASLGVWIGQPIDVMQLVMPEMEELNLKLNRPELEIFATNKDKLAANQDLIHSSRLPKLSAFATGGLGQPNPYNFFNADFDSYYMIGARLEWSLFNWGEVKNKEKKLALQRDLVNQEQAHFEQTLLNQTDLMQQDLARLETVIESDDKLYELQKKIFESDRNRFEQGVLSATEYVSSLNELQQLDLQKELDRLQLSRTKIELLNLTGNL